MLRTLLFTLIAAGVWAIPARSEKAPMSPEELRQTATHIVTGQVTAVYERKENAGNWSYNHYVAEVKVDTCEKGDGIKKGDMVYVRYWQRRWIGKDQQPPSTIGHRGLPERGDMQRIYVARNAYDGFSNGNNDGGFNVIGANGFEKLKKAGK